MDIFSKRDGPRAEDVRAKRLISENAGTIRKLADQISNGGFTKMRQDQARRKEEPKPEGLLIYSMGAMAHSEVPDPYVRVSLNGRVVIADRNNGKQLDFLGEIRREVGAKRFVLATKENGFISPVSNEIRELLAQYDSVELSADFTEEDIVQSFGKALGLTDKTQGCSDDQTGRGDDTPEDDSRELL